MNLSSDNILIAIRGQLGPALPGMLFAVVTLIFGFGLGIALILLTSLLSSSPGLTLAISLGLGLGGLGYSVFWLWAGFRAPGLGDPGAAKESLKWLAMPAAGALMVATVAVAVLVVVAIIRRPPTVSPN